MNETRLEFRGYAAGGYAIPSFSIVLGQRIWIRVPFDLDVDELANCLADTDNWEGLASPAIYADPVRLADPAGRGLTERLLPAIRKLSDSASLFVYHTRGLDPRGRKLVDDTVAENRNRVSIRLASGTLYRGSVSWEEEWPGETVIELASDDEIVKRAPPSAHTDRVMDLFRKALEESESRAKAASHST